MSEIFTGKYKGKILTIPNLLSFIRICLIPIIVFTFIEANYFICGTILLLSSLTDILDGMIARRFNMISDVGKVLDPIADKATQLVVAILLSTKYSYMILLIALCLIKEIFMAITGYMVIKKQNIVLGAEWYGKLSTIIVILTMLLHLFWYNISPSVSFITISVSSATVILSLALYCIRNFTYILSAQK